MAKSKYEYVKAFEADAVLLPRCWVVIRLDGKGFTKFSELHGFEKPNDVRALQLMDACAVEVLKLFGDIRLAYGQSDEYSFVFKKSCNLYGRRSSKLISLVTSCFSASYVRLWPEFFDSQTLLCTPMFDGRAVCYPTDAILRDYLAWRQADAHINYQFNTCFWALVKGGASRVEAQAALRGTQTEQKNELLFSKYGINYATLPERFRKGSVLVQGKELRSVKLGSDGQPVQRKCSMPSISHVDIIGDKFWIEHPELLGP